MKLYKFLMVILFSYITVSGQVNEISKNFWQVGFTFGEIPVLSGSFKPGVTFAYYFNEKLSAEFTFQMKDYLNRDDESFNAVKIGYDGLISSKESTGERLFLGFRFKPVKWSPYLTAGFVLNFTDKETIKFDDRKRIVGSNTYEGELEIVQKRKTGLAPAFGIGYQYDFDNGISLNTSFAMAFFNNIPSPVTEINSADEVSEEDRNLLDRKLETTYKDNFHNRYHIFNLGIIYRLK